MSSLRDNFSTGMNFLRRRFSSDDLYSERQGEEEPDIQRFSFGKKIGLPTAPSFPSFSAVQGVTRGILSQTGSVSAAAAAGVQKVLFNKDRCKVLLIIDDRHTDWSKYFRGRKILGDWDLRVEQAEFSEINVASYSDSGAVVDVLSTKNGTKVVQSFKPDFVLVRQHARDASEDWKHIVLGLHYGGLPSVNSLLSVYNFLDKPWVFSHLIQIRKRVGREKFPLIDQAYYPNHREMASNLWLVIPKFPVVVKIGHAHSGMGKVKVDNHYGFQDIASVMAVTSCYSTTEPHIDAQCDIYIQKIGSIYKAYMRKAMSGNWKANIGSAILESIPVTDRFKSWIDECAILFGGLDVLSVKAIRAKDGQEYIIEVNDSSMTLLGNSPDDDYRSIADLVVRRFEEHFVTNKKQESSMTSSNPRSLSGHYVNSNGLAPDGSSVSQQNAGGSSPARGGGGGGGGGGGSLPPASSSPSMGRLTQSSSSSSSSPPNRQPNSNFSSPPAPPPNRSASEPAAVAPRSNRPASPRTVEAIARDLEESEPDDTMNNLRKTFAGIFGNI